MVTARFRSPDFRSAQSRTTLAVAIFVRLPTCSFFLGSCSSKMYPVCASAITYACAAAAERTTDAFAKNATETMRNRRDKCINDFEPQHLNRRILIGKRFGDAVSAKGAGLIASLGQRPRICRMKEALALKARLTPGACSQSQTYRSSTSTSGMVRMK